jgi:hypothetical protein
VHEDHTVADFARKVHFVRHHQQRPVDAVRHKRTMRLWHQPVLQAQSGLSLQTPKSKQKSKAVSGSLQSLRPLFLRFVTAGRGQVKVSKAISKLSPESANFYSL